MTRDVKWVAAGIAAMVIFADTASAQTKRFDVGPGKLGSVAANLGAQAGITIAIPDADIAKRRSPGVRGKYSVRDALSRALQGTGAEAIFYDERTVRIAKKRRTQPAPARAQRPTAPAPPPPPPPSPAPPPEEIVVTASKQNIASVNYPGSVKIADFEPDWLVRNAARGSAAIIGRQPAIGSTNLGPGRNKLFVRGIADSSFNGQTQATVGQYLGEARLNYNAPDPDLNLYDMKRAEILVGPQGTLYGAGSLGGIIRLVPRMPDSKAAEASAALGVSTTRSGGIGGDAAAMVNLPIIEGRAAMRLVAYGSREAGYIDDPQRHVSNINRSRIVGQRLSVRVDDLAGWTIDVGGVSQETSVRDGQYTLRNRPPLTRSNPIAQPFDNDYGLAFLNLRRTLGSKEIVSTTSAVRHRLRSVFDAAGGDEAQVPKLFEERNNISFISHETRISGGGRRSPWVAGIAVLYNVNKIARALGPPDAPLEIAALQNEQTEFAVFGQATLPLGRYLGLTLGSRFATAHSEGQLARAGELISVETSGDKLNILPTAALDWHPEKNFSAFFRYQQGVRSGGLAATATGSPDDTQEFVGDDMTLAELGFRAGAEEGDPLSFRFSLFAVDWNDIQADLIDSAGLPYTANIGSGRIFGADGELAWRASPALTLNAAAFLNDSHLNPDDALATRGAMMLPGIARYGAYVGANWQRKIRSGLDLAATATLRFVGKSYLGAGSPLDVPQGGYSVGSIGARLSTGRVGFSMDVDNLTNARANTFAFGNPFRLADRNQETPLRPRTVRVGVDIRF